MNFNFPVQQKPFVPSDLWIIGLGHLGQAYLWTVMLQSQELRPRMVRLTDDDEVSVSSLSTCLLVNQTDVGRLKVEVIAERLEALGVSVQKDPTRLNLDSDAVDSLHRLCIVAVDNLGLRRSLDKVHGARVWEAGIGDGSDGFTRIQAHAFPGPRMARDIWLGDDPKASRSIDISKPAVFVNVVVASSVF